MADGRANHGACASVRASRGRPSSNGPGSATSTLIANEKTMSVSSAKASVFPTACANSACGQALCGPVKHCPFCGVALQQAPAAVTPPAPKPVAPPAAPKPVPPVVAAPPVDPPASAPEPSVVAGAAPAPPDAAPTPAPKVKKPIMKIVIGALVLVGGGYVALKMTAGQDHQKFETYLQAGQTCLNAQNFACALDNAGLALQQDRNEPRALSLLQRAQAAQERQQQKLAADQKQQQLKAQAAEAARQASAQREQEALDRQRQDAANRQLREQQQQQASQAVNASLQQAQNALNAGEYQSAIAVAKVALGMDPHNARARSIIRQAEQQLKEALNRTRIE